MRAVTLSLCLVAVVAEDVFDGVVAFCAPWCHHCDNLVFDGRVVEEDSAYFPQIKLYEYGRLIAEYQGPHDGIDAWAESFRVENIESWAQARAFFEHDTYILGIRTDPPLLGVKTGRAEENYAGEEQPPGIVVVANGERYWVDNSSQVEGYLHPAVSIYEGQSFDDEGDLAILVADEPSEMFQEIAERYRTRLRHILAVNDRVKERFGGQGGLYVLSRGKRFRCPSIQTRDDVESCYDLFFTNSLKVSLRSEPEYPQEEAGIVKRLVASSFPLKKESLVVFTAPWCFHCQALQPHLDTLAEMLRKVDSVDVCTVDLTKNDPPLPVKAVPEIYFFYPQKGQVKYQGETSLENLLSFVRERATQAF